jgi:leader peptidase (prepilin peptidase)/N-methyltransferase
VLSGVLGSGQVSARPFLRHRVPVATLALALAALAFASYPAGAAAAIAAFLAAVLVVLAATDLERMAIPNRVVLPATVVVLLSRVLVSPDHASVYALAAVAAALAFLVPNLINHSLMGMGDVKLATLLGAGLGLGVVGAIAVAFLAIFPFALGMVVRGGLAARKGVLPFGPFLALGGLVVLIVPRFIGG